MLRRLLRETSIYSAGNVLGVLAGLISFPILTRTLTLADYGLLSLINVTITLLTGVAKLGIQHSVNRYYAEADAPTAPGDAKPRLYATTVYGIATAGMVAALLWGLVSLTVPLGWWGATATHFALLIAASVVAVRSLESGLINLLRAQQRSGSYSIYSVAKKYVSLSLILVAVLSIAPRVDLILAATFIAELGVVLSLFYYMFHRGGLPPAQVDLGLFKRMLAFGLPMVGYEIGGITMSISNRYVLNHFATQEAVGIYSALHNIAEYSNSILVLAFGQAVVPIYMKLWEQRGPAATSEFLSRALAVYLCAAGGLAMGLSACGPALITLLASEKFLVGADLIPWIITGMLVEGMIVIVAAGIFVRKNTTLMLYLMVGGAMLNLTMNFALIPQYGMKGAAISTLLTYVALATAAIRLGRAQLQVSFSAAQFLRIVGSAVLAWWIASLISIENPFLEILARGSLGLSCYLASIALVDRQLRDIGIEGFKSLERGN